MFNHYRLSHHEEWINSRYYEACIHSPADLDIDRIADVFGIEVYTYEGRSVADWQDGEYAYILLNDQLTCEQRREQFFHELCHPLKHGGNQGSLPASFVELQEIQAGLFQLYAAMPLYMIDPYTSVSEAVLPKVLAEEFRLPEPFVLKRLEQIQQRCAMVKRQTPVNRWNEELEPRQPLEEKDHVRKILEQLKQKQMLRGGQLA